MAHQPFPAVGALLLAAALARTDGRPHRHGRRHAGVAILAWPPLLAAGLDGPPVVDQMLVGLSWAVVGLLDRYRSISPVPTAAA